MLLKINKFYIPMDKWALPAPKLRGNPHVCSCPCCVR